MMADPKDWLDFARDAQSGTEAVQARFHAHAYDPHFHDQVLVGVTLQGVQQFRCRRAIHRSTPGRVILMEPGETHDGEAVIEDGFTYAMLYFAPDWLRQAGADYLGRSDAPQILAFRETLNDDAALGQAIVTACSRMLRREGRMAREAALDAVLPHLLRRAGETDASQAAHAAPRIASRARDIIEARYDSDLGLEELASQTGTDRFRLTRAFKAAYGIAPHAYLVQRRLNRARQLLARGEAPAKVAAATGFADQSHLGRWFRRAFGMTPADYRRRCTDLPDAVIA